MRDWREAYDSLSELLRYPQPGYAAFWNRAIGIIEQSHADAAETLKSFVAETAELDLEELEELYTRSFDLNPATTLEVGWHLWGDAYERGRFMAKMRERLSELDICEGGELPDHLTSVLQLLPRIDDDKMDWWANEYLIRALGRMRKPLKDTTNPYRHLLDAIEQFVRRNHEGKGIPVSGVAPEASYFSIHDLDEWGGTPSDAPAIPRVTAPLGEEALL